MAMGSIQPYCPTVLLHCFENVGLGRVGTGPFPTPARTLPNSASISDRKWIYSDSWTRNTHERAIKVFLETVASRDACEGIYPLRH